MSVLAGVYSPPPPFLRPRFFCRLSPTFVFFAEDGAEMLRMMKMWSFQQQAPAVASAGGAGTGTGAEAGVDQEMVAGQQLH